MKLRFLVVSVIYVTFAFGFNACSSPETSLSPSYVKPEAASTAAAATVETRLTGSVRTVITRQPIDKYSDQSVQESPSTIAVSNDTILTGVFVICAALITALATIIAAIISKK